jgi:molecular chaperone HtpG
VADKLAEIFRSDREDFEKKWDDIKLFIQYGMLSDEKFYDRAINFALVKNIDSQYFTFEEYKEKVKDNQTDKNGDLVLLYAQNTDTSYAYIQRAKEKGYDVLLMDGELDVHAMSQQEQKAFELDTDKQEGKHKGGLRFVRVDADVIENLIQKEDKAKVELTEDEEKTLRECFENLLPKTDKTNYSVSLEAVSADALPVFLTQNEFMRRMKEMSAHQQGMSFYGNMPDQYTLVINTANEKIKDLLTVDSEQLTVKSQQLIDIAMLAAGQLKGEALAKFVNRSVELL